MRRIVDGRYHSKPSNFRVVLPLPEWLQGSFQGSSPSRINRFKRSFAYVSYDLLRRRVQVLEKNIREWVKNWNENLKRFISTRKADQILEPLKRLLKQIVGAGHQGHDSGSFPESLAGSHPEARPRPECANGAGFR